MLQQQQQAPVPVPVAVRRRNNKERSSKNSDDSSNRNPRALPARWIARCASRLSLSPKRIIHGW